MSSSDGAVAKGFTSRVKHMESSSTKALRIKVNGLKRNLKDMEFAKKEIVCETARLESIRENNPDRINQQENVIAEAQMMIPHCENRIRTAIKDLQDFLANHNDDAKDEELTADACATLEKAQQTLSQQ